MTTIEITLTHSVFVKTNNHETETLTGKPLQNMTHKELQEAANNPQGLGREIWNKINNMTTGTHQQRNAVAAATTDATLTINPIDNENYITDPIPWP